MIIILDITIIIYPIEFHWDLKRIKCTQILLLSHRDKETIILDDLSNFL